MSAEQAETAQQAESAPAPATTMRRIARSSSLNLVGAAAGAALTLLVTSFVARGASETTAGSLFAATSVFLILSGLAELGSDVSLAKFLPQYLVRNEVPELLTVIRAATLATLAASCTVGAVLFVARDSLADLVSSASGEEQTRQAIVVLAVAVPLAATMNTVLSATRGLWTVRPTVLVDKVGRGVLQVVGVGACAGSGITVLTTAWAAPYLLGMAASAWWLRSLLRGSTAGKAEVTAAAFRSPVLTEYVRYTWPRALARLCQVVLQRGDIVLVAALRSPAEAAVYAVATRFLVVGQLGSLAIQQVVAPQASRLLAAQDTAGAARLFQISTAWTMLVTWPLYLVSIGGASELLRLFAGSAYSGATTIVVVLALATLFASACGPVDTMLLMYGRSRLSLINSFAALVVDFVADAILVPTLGAEGAALGWALAILARNGLGLMQVRRHIGSVPFSRPAGYVGVVSTATLAIPLIVLRLFGVDADATVAALLGLGVVGYAAALWRGREVLSLAAFTSVLPRPVGHPRRPAAEHSA